MIPTLLLVGLAFGRWWRIAVPITTVVWVVAVLVTTEATMADDALAAAVLAVVNLAVGVLIFQAGRFMFLRMFPRRSDTGF